MAACIGNTCRNDITRQIDTDIDASFRRTCEGERIIIGREVVRSAGIVREGRDGRRIGPRQIDCDI